MTTSLVGVVPTVDEVLLAVPGARHAAIVGSDGLLLASSSRLARTQADQLAAIAAGLASLTRGAARCLGDGAVEQVMVEMSLGFVLVMSIGADSMLTVLADRDADVGSVAYGMAEFVARLGDARPPRSMPGPTPVKVVVAGGFGVGKTTYVGAVSEITPLSTEAATTEVGLGIDDSLGLTRKATTTVAMDFGRLSLPGGVGLYLFGTPGQDRFWFMWDELVRGAIGAVVLCDSRRLADSFHAVDFFESRGLPFVIGVNDFDNVISHDLDDIRDALAVQGDVPVLRVDARDATSAKAGLVALVRHALARAS